MFRMLYFLYMLYFISIHFYILEKVFDIFFHKFKNVLKKSVCWIYQQYFG